MDRIKWSELEPEFFDTWGKGSDGQTVKSEHVSVVGPTGSGKSNFQSYVLRKRHEIRGTNAIVIATKPADSTLRKMHWPIVRKYPPEWGKHEAFILWPESHKDPRTQLLSQRNTIGQCLTDIWHPNSNTIVAFDEIAYVEQELRLKILIDRYWREARSLGITIMATTQRPRNVSRYMWSEPTWLVAFRPDDEDEAKRVAEIMGGRRKFTEPLLELNEFEFIIVKRRAKDAYISKLPKT